MRPALPALLVVLLGGATVRAGIRPPVAPDRCAWEATDVAVVSEGEAIDGVLRVLEV